MTSAPSRTLDDGDRDGYWQALVAGDTHTAFAVSRRALARGVPLDSVLEGLVADSQCKVGELWAANAWNVAQEHRATAVSREVVSRLGLLLQPSDGPGVVMACAEREQHALPAEVIAAQLRGRGQRVDLLGGAAGVERLREAITRERPRAVLLSASLTSSLMHARRQIVACRELGVPVVVGGSGFDRDGVRSRRLGANAQAATADGALEVLAGLPDRVDPAPPLTHPGARDAEAIRADNDAVARDVLARVSRRMRLDSSAGTLPLDDWRVVMATLVPHVVDCLCAALLTDDPAILVELRAWLDEVLTHRGSHPDAVAELWLALAYRLDEQPEALRLLAG